MRPERISQDLPAAFGGVPFKPWVKIPIALTLAIGFMALGAWWSTRNSATAGSDGCAEAVTVIVSKVDIPPNTKLDPSIDAGDFYSVCVPADALVDGAITSVEELRSQTTAAQIYAHEQIPVFRLVGSA